MRNLIRNLESRIARLEKKARAYIPSEEESIREYDTRDGWVILDRSEHQSYLPDIWDMYVKTYKRIGLTVKDPMTLINKYEIFYVHFDNGEPIAFNLFKRTGFGLKSALSGNDGSPAGRATSKAWIKTRWKSVPNFYAEVSGAVEHISIKSGAPVVCNAYVESVLGKPTDGLDEDNVHYHRNFGGHRHMKIMIGKPRGIQSTSYSEALLSCPVADEGFRTASTTRTSSFDIRLAHDCSTYENSLFRG